ncbi:MAG: UbiA family prenyltransferase [Phycisphaerales bacterium]|nr:UbiA family prenyltransferase [Phycisphaerales bacterium]
MSHRLRTFLELVRLPNLFTAPPDVIAGACAGGAILDGMPAGRWLAVGALCLASMHLYAGGVALNDVMDAERDEADRPDRPIPSQRISRASALRVSILLLTAGAAVALAVSARTGIVALGLIGAMVAYNSLKARWFAPALMGLCRALNMALGMALGSREAGVEMLWPAACLGLYVAGVTVFARRETRAGFEWTRIVGLSVVVASMVAYLQIWVEFSPQASWLSAALAGIWTFTCGFGLCAVGSRPARAQEAVVVFILGIVLLDAWLAAVLTGPASGAIALAFAIPFILLARGFRPT